MERSKSTMKISRRRVASGHDGRDLGASFRWVAATDMSKAPRVLDSGRLLNKRTAGFRAASACRNVELASECSRATVAVKSK